MKSLWQKINEAIESKTSVYGMFMREGKDIPKSELPPNMPHKNTVYRFTGGKLDMTTEKVDAILQRLGMKIEIVDDPHNPVEFPDHTEREPGWIASGRNDHGTVACYNYGCRCNKCRDRAAKYRQERRKAQKLKEKEQQ